MSDPTASSDDNDPEQNAAKEREPEHLIRQRGGSYGRQSWIVCQLLQVDVLPSRLSRSSGQRPG
jgi:hypothetical protein